MLRIALWRQVYRPCWAATEQLLRTWFSVSTAEQFGQESVDDLPQRWRLEFVGRHRIRAFLAKLATGGDISERWEDHPVNSDAVREALRAFISMDCTQSPSSCSLRPLSWKFFAASAAFFFVVRLRRSLNGNMVPVRVWRVAIFGSRERAARGQ